MIRYRSAFRTTTWGLVVALALMCTACGGPWRDTYFKKGVDRLTQDDVREKLGTPHTAKTPALGGDSVWTYRVSMGDKELESMASPGLSGAGESVGALLGKPGEGPKPTLYCFRYTLTFNEQKVLKSWKREECVPGTRETLMAQ
ncbi:MAG: hypothetical protein CAF44_005940 [Nitrospira sp. CG24D]|nr:MAG: hypothetical protein CAF44_005940 [Nitrospira sp. CG24D]